MAENHAGDPGPMTRTADLLAAGVRDGLHPGAQLAVIFKGRTVADWACGHARAGVPLRPTHTTLWMSAGKPLTAVWAATLVGRGLLDLDAPVADVWPDFAAGGKHLVTTRHLLTHTGGFRNVSSNWSSEPWQAVAARVAGASIEEGWKPGGRAGYHVASGWYALAEVCRRLEGVGPTDAAVSGAIRDNVVRPLGMDGACVGMARRAYVDLGTDSAVTCDTQRQPPTPLAFPNSEQGHVLCRPGGNARGPARTLATFYAGLLDDLNGQGVLLPAEVAREFTSRQRVGMRDETFKSDIDWGLGFLIADAGGGRVPYGYGPHASPDAFGHSGNQSSCGFADPRHGLAAAWVTTGLPGELAHQRRQHALNAAIYEDLGLSG